MMKKTIFEIIGNFSEMRLFKIPVKSPVLQISEDLVFFEFATSWRPHVNWNVLR